MLLTIARYGEGKCVWCQTQSEGVQAAFKDGLSGFFCRKHLWDALRAREGTEESDASRAPSSPKA